MRSDKDRIAAAIPYVRIARRRLREYQDRGSWCTPDELYKIERLCSFALENMGYKSTKDDDRSDSLGTQQD